MKSITSTKKQSLKPSSKTVSLYLPTHSVSKQIKENSSKLQNTGTSKPNQEILKHSPKLGEVQIDLNLPLKNIAQSVLSTEPLEKETCYDNQDQQKDLALLLQKVEFLETQLKEGSNKLHTQEHMYEQLIKAYAQTQEDYPLQNLLNKVPVIEDLPKASDNVLPYKQKNQETVQEDLENKLMLLERTLEQQATEYRFIIKDQKHQIQELEMKLKHNENRNIQNQEFQFRITEEIKDKHMIEIEGIQQNKQLEIEGINDRNYQLIESLKEVYQTENNHLNQKVNELKGQLRMQELQIQEYQGENHNQLNFNMEALENIHLRYLEEIKNLNITLGAFRQEKENEIKALQEQVKQSESKAHKEESLNKDLSHKIIQQKESYESKITEGRKKLDAAFKSLADHEKCEITIQGLKKRLNELKYKLEQLEYKEKWTLKALVNKRSQIESEKVDLKQKMVTQLKSNKNRLMSQQKQNGTLQTKMVHLNDELEMSQRHKEQLQGKVQELTKELEIIKSDQMSNSICISQRSIMARSVSPRQTQAHRFMNGRSKNLLNKTANLSKIIEKIGGKQILETSPKANQTEKSMFLAINQNLGASIESSIHPSPSNSHQQNQNKFSMNNQSHDEMSSFLASPKVEGLSFIKHGCEQTRSKAVSHYESRCTQCTLTFQNEIAFLNHQCQDKDSNSNGSPEIRGKSSYLKTQHSQNNLNGFKSKTSTENPSCIQKTGSQGNLLSTPKHNKSSFFKPVKSRNNDFIQSKSNLSQQPTGNFQIKQIIEDPQIIQNKNPLLSDSLALTIEESNMIDSAKQINSSSIFHPSILSQSQNIHNNSLNTTRTNYELEKENDKIMIELKQAKIDLALCQEISSATELQLKKDIVALQYQMSHLMGGASQNQSFASTQGFQSHMRQNSTQELFNNNLNGTNINIQTTNVTCYNIGYKNEFPYGANGSPRQHAEGSFNNIPPTTTPLKPSKLQIFKGEAKQEDNLDSPSLLYSTVGEETLPQGSNLSKNQQIRINRSPTLLLQKQ